ncbi:hypothetical protein [Alloprevotella sp. OH1205_COT-284]|uniref:hypothetical protein n=1 Tax=Alloprevotella sp. OH1205_COT-284 TaxID=2491043 RepID=UPI001315408D|nr:hypothetical protein [Alloprevotella sp. OH1205_COT-284]
MEICVRLHRDNRQFFSENEPQRHIPRSVSTRVTLPHHYTSRKRKDTAKPPRL